MNILRRLPLARLLLLCGLVVAIGISATALALALGDGPTPPGKPLAEAVHDALGASPVQGVSANITFTDHLLEGANLASESGQGGGGGLASSPLVAGASGRLWISSDGRVRIELQDEQGDTQILYDGHTVSIYDAASNTLYRYTPPAGSSTGTGSPAEQGTDQHSPPSVAQIEEAITHLSKHVDVSGAIPTDVAGQPAYTVRVSPKEDGSLIGGAELSFDANNGIPLRTAIYSSTSSSPVIELAATEVSYGPVDGSVFAFTPPSSARVEELTGSLPDGHHAAPTAGDASKPTVQAHGHGITAIAVLQTKAKPGQNEPGGSSEDLPKVSINGASASELRTELGTILTFERSGVRYVLGGALAPAAVEALARSL